MIRFNINSNITDLVNWAKQIPSIVSNEKIAETCARKFAERAKARLASSGALQEDISRYVNAITFEKVADNKWRISAGKNGDRQLKDDMYYLEFGTGIVGAKKPHPEASKIGWDYNVNKHSDFQTALSKKGNRYTKGGWTFRRGNQNAFIAKDDIIHTYKRSQHKGSTTGWQGARRVRTEDISAGSEKSIQSKGVISVRYFYDTMLEFNQILLEALQENGV